MTSLCTQTSLYNFSFESSWRSGNGTFLAEHYDNTSKILRESKLEPASVALPLQKVDSWTRGIAFRPQSQAICFLLLFCLF